VRETSQAAQVPIEYNSRGAERRLGPETELALYRMVQEALSNLVRHSKASQGWVDLAYTPSGVELAVRDNGQGFTVPENPGEFAPAGHFGLLGLHERADLINARLELASSPGNGTILRIYLPVTNPVKV